MVANSPVLREAVRLSLEFLNQVVSKVGFGTQTRLSTEVVS